MAAHTSLKQTLIVFDLETTGLIEGDKYPHITRIAAIKLRSKKSFDVYVKPKIPMTKTASEVSGIAMTKSGAMMVKGKEVATVSITEAIESFCKWLDQFPNVVLIAHNGLRFDFKVMDEATRNVDMPERYWSCVSGLIDSLPIFQEKFLDLESYSRRALAKDLLDLDYEADEGLEKITALKKLIKFLKLPSVELLSYKISPQSENMDWV